MRTSFPCPAKTLFLNVTMAIILLPFFAVFAAIVHLPIHGEGTWYTEATLWSRAGLVVLVFIVPLAALLLVLWKGWARLPLAALLLALIGFRILLSIEYDSSDHYRHIGLQIGQYTTTPGVDVYCNGVHLGKTPLCLSRQEFEQKVSPWTKPPRQERLLKSDFPNLEWHGAQGTWIPEDVFQEFDLKPGIHSHRDDVDVLKAIQSSRYWWRFEADGHQGITSFSNFINGYQGSGIRLQLNASPNISYPALAPHLALVIDGLLAEKEGPSEAWIAHFRKYKNLLFLPFFEKAKTDPRLRAALDAVVRVEFDMPKKPTPQDCDRILGTILDSVETRGYFQTPSFDTIAIDLMGNELHDCLVRRYPRESSYWITAGGQSSSDSYTIVHRDGKAVRQLPLVYAIKRIQPPELFDMLVYQWARTHVYFHLLANYQNKKAVDLVTRYYVDLRDRGSQSRIQHELSLLAEINNPKVEDWLRDFVRENGTGSFRDHYVTKFVESRINAPGMYQGDLARWVYHFAPLDDREKQRLLLRINSKDTANCIRNAGWLENPRTLQEIVSTLAAHPNPSLAELLAEAYVNAGKPEYMSYGYCGALILSAIVQIDSPAVQKFVTDQWQAPARRAVLLQDLTMSVKKEHLARLGWMLPLADKLTDAESKIAASRLVGAIRTPEADKLLDRWASEGNKDLRDAVEQQRAEQKKADAEHAQRLQQWSDLLAEKIQPEDLVPREKPWNWNGKKYVQEK